MSTSYSIKPLHKKSIVEFNLYKREIDGVNYFMRKESTYRWGEFTIEVPEGDELTRFCLDRGYNSWEEMIEDYGYEETTSVADFFLPCADDDYHDMDDWEAEVQDLDDECSCFFEVWTTDDADVPEDYLEALQESVEDIYEEEWDSGLEEAGWIYHGCSFEITSPISIFPN